MTPTKARFAREYEKASLLEKQRLLPDALDG